MRALQEHKKVLFSTLNSESILFIPSKEEASKAKNVFVFTITEWPLIVVVPNSYMDFVTTVESWVTKLDTDLKLSDAGIRESGQSSGSQIPREDNSSSSEVSQEERCESDAESRSSGSGDWSRIDDENFTSEEEERFGYTNAGLLSIQQLDYQQPGLSQFRILRKALLILHVKFREEDERKES